MKSFLCLVVLFGVTQGAIDWKNVKPISDFYPELKRSGSSGFDEKIVGGEEVEPHSYPYQVGIILQLFGNQAFCGGSLISDQDVLTAAHCAQFVKNFTIILGAHKVQEPEDTQVIIETKSKTVHPRWIRLLLLNDIAIIHLPEKVQLNENIQLVRLPSYSDVNKTYAEGMGTVSGWGKASDSSSTISPVLRAVENKILSNKRCIWRLLNVVRKTHMCLSGKHGKSSCAGDSGGPLVVKDEDGQRTEVGIVSFGLSIGCEVGAPGGFTRVTEYLDWIQDNSQAKIRP